MKRFFLLIIIVLCVSLIVNNDSFLSKIYSIKANLFLNTSNVEKTLNNYEKSFNYGNVSTKDRENYIKKIINLSIDSEIQKKLINFLKIKIKDNAYILAQNSLIEIREEVSRIYPNNYIRQASYNQKIVRWNKFPVTYSIESNENVPEFYIKEIERAFETWQNSMNNQIHFKKNHKKSDIKIVFTKPDLLSNVSTNKIIIANTMPCIEANELIQMIIDFRITDYKGNYFEKQKIYYIALHEIAHALGVLGHSNCAEDILYLYSNENQIFNNSTILSQADVNTMKLLYNTKPDISNKLDGFFKYHPQIIIGNSNDITIAKSREAEIYIDTAPKCSTGYINLAEVYVSEKNYKKAIENLKIALNYAESRKILALLYHNLAVIYYLDENYASALKYIQKALEINDEVEYQYVLAKILLKINKEKQAIKLYENFVQNNPDNIDYIIELINIYIKQYDYMNAIKILKQYFKDNPKARNNERFKSYGILKILALVL